MMEDIVDLLDNACTLKTSSRELERLCGNARIEIKCLRASLDAYKACEDINKPPPGWALHTADFSLQAAGMGETGTVRLVRDAEHRALWHLQPDSDKEAKDGPALYAFGEGVTFQEAMQNAAIAALSANPIINQGT